MIVEGERFSLQLEGEKSVGADLRQRRLARRDAPAKEISVARYDRGGGDGDGGPAGVVVEARPRPLGVEAGAHLSPHVAEPGRDLRPLGRIDAGGVADAQVGEREAGEGPDTFVRALLVHRPEQCASFRPPVQGLDEAVRVGGIGRTAHLPAVGQRGDLGQVGAQRTDGGFVSSLERRIGDRVVAVRVVGDAEEIANGRNASAGRGSGERPAEALPARGILGERIPAEGARGAATLDVVGSVEGTTTDAPGGRGATSGLGDERQRQDCGARPARRHRTRPMITPI